MQPVKPVITVSLLAALLAVLQSAAGLFWPVNGSGPFSFTTVHGEVVQIYGQGLYHFDSYFRAPINRGTDAVTLFFAVPLLLIALWYYSRGSLRGLICTAGMLSYLLYNAASVALSISYNSMFLVYIAYFSSSLFALILAINAVDLRELGSRLANNAPRKGIAALMFVSALGLVAAWLPDIIIALMENRAIDIQHYTTEVTHVFDLGIIVPITLLSGVYVLRRAPISYLSSAVMMVLSTNIGVMVVIQTVFQSAAGIENPVGVLIGKVVSFILLGLFSILLVVRLLRSINETAAPAAKKLHGKAARA